jgi:hypothetical protein
MRQVINDNNTKIRCLTSEKHTTQPDIPQYHMHLANHNIQEAATSIDPEQHCRSSNL